MTIVTFIPILITKILNKTLKFTEKTRCIAEINKDKNKIKLKAVSF